MPDASWLTKAQAAEAIGCSTKTVEQLAQAGQLQQGVYRPQDRGPRRAVYHPDDVARVAAARRGAPTAFVLPADQTSANGNGHQVERASPGDLAARVLAGERLPGDGEILRALVAAALRGLTSQSSEKLGSKLFLTVAEGADFSGLPARYLRRLVREGTLEAVKPSTNPRSWRIRRRDLEAL